MTKPRDRPRGQFDGSRPGPGRPKGTPNKATALAREAFANFIADNAGRVQELFDQVAADNPAKALELMTRIAEFVIPKQQRTEIDGELGLRGQLIIHE